MLDAVTNRLIIHNKGASYSSRQLVPVNSRVVLSTMVNAFVDVTHIERAECKKVVCRCWMPLCELAEASDVVWDKLVSGASVEVEVGRVLEALEVIAFDNLVKEGLDVI